MFKDLLCKLHIQHHWHVEHADDGSFSKRCLRCGKDYDGGNFSVWFLPLGGGGGS
jgi:hypothetical protein